MSLEILLHTLCELAIKYNLVNYAAGGPSLYAINAETIKDYPFIFVSPTDEIMVRENLTTFGLTIFYCDRLLAERTNETQIFSVGIDTLNNFIRQLRELEGIVEIGDYPVRLFTETERMSDRVCGAYARISLSVLNDIDCAVWFDDQSEPEPVDPDTGSTPTPITDVVIVNSIFPTNPADNKMVLPFDTDKDMEMWFEGQLLTSVQGICFGGNVENDENDFRFFCTTSAYLDCGGERIEDSTPDRDNIRKVHTFNYGFELTYADGSVRTTEGTEVSKAPRLDGVINVGMMRIRSFKVTLGNELLYDGVPARRKRDGKLGLYDRVRGWFTVPPSQHYLTYD